MYRIPIYRVTLVRDGSQPSGTRTVSTPTDAVDVLRAYLQPDSLDREHFAVMLLDAKNHIIGINTVSIGELSSALVHPREVYKPAILASAAGIIVGHNHPSGDPTPSRADIELTRRLAQAGELLGITCLDSLILGDGGRYYSLRDRGDM